MTAQQPIRSTALKAGRLSMAHMRLAMMRRAGEAEDADMPAMRWGRLVHLAVLQPSAMAALPVWRGAVRRGKEWEAFMLTAPGGEYVTQNEVAEILDITRSAAIAMAQLPSVRETEVNIEWTDPVYGAGMAQLDALLADGGKLELKTTARIEERAFASQAWSLGYPLQVGWYDYAARKAGHLGPHIILAIESKPPYCCALWEIGPQTLRDGYQEGAEIAARYRRCEVAGRFPGPYDSEGIMKLEPPAWAVNDAIDMNGMEGASEDVL